MTIKEIAEQLQLSATTVSRVLNGQATKYRISPQTEQKVQVFVAKQGFSPNLLARNLRMQKTDTIGLVIPDISNPFFAQLAKTLELALRKKGKLILLCDTHEDSDLEKESIALLLGRKVDGLLVASVGLQSKHLSEIDIPIILIDRYFPALKTPYISTNNYQGAYLATNYLIERGHQKIACLQGLKNAVSNQERVRGFQQAMRDAHLPMHIEHILGKDFSSSSGYKAAQRLLGQEELPTAVFTLGNQIAIGAIQAFREAHKKIPTDISMISFDEQPYFQLTEPPITTVKQPVGLIAQKAVDMLMNKMEGKETTSELLAPKLIERASVKVLR